MVKKKAINLFLVLFILLLIVQLNFVLSFDNPSFFYPEDARPCNLDDVTELIERYAETCQRKEGPFPYYCNDINSDNYGIGITFRERHVDDVHNDDCLDLANKLNECYIPLTGSGRSSLFSYLGSVLELKNLRIGYPNVGAAPTCFMIINDVNLCDTANLDSSVALCKKEMNEIDYEPYIKKAERNLLYTKSELVDDGYAWFNEAPKSAKINGLRKRAETASMSLGRTAYDSNRITELDEFRVAMTYYLKAKGGAYGLAKNYYAFKDFSGDYIPLFDNVGRYQLKENKNMIDSIILGLFGLSETCVPKFSVTQIPEKKQGGICAGSSNLVRAFYSNTWPDGLDVACDVDFLTTEIDEVIKIGEGNLRTRKVTFSLKKASQSCMEIINANSYYLQKKFEGYNADDLPWVDSSEDVVFPDQREIYLSKVDSLSEGVAPSGVLAGYEPTTNIFGTVTGVDRVYHSIFYLMAGGSGNLLVYDPNNIGISVISPIMTLDKKLVIDYHNFILWLDDDTPNYLLLHTKNCKCPHICEDYSNENYYFIKNGERTHLSLIDLDWAIDFLSDEFFNKWLEYQYADYACF